MGCHQVEVMNESDYQLKEQLKKNMEVVPVFDINNPKRKYKFEFEYVIQGGRKEEIFHPKNSNYIEALKSNDRIIKKIKRLYPQLLPAYHKTFTEHEEAGYLERLSPKEIEALKVVPHNFLYHNLVLNSHSTTTPLRRIQDTSIKLKGANGTHSSLISSPAGALNNLMQSQLKWYTFYYAALLDVKRAYKMIGIKPSSQLLSLTIWREPPHDQNSEIIVFRDTCYSFGNGQSAAALALCLDHISDQIPCPDARHILKKQTIADDCRDSNGDPQKLLQICNTIMEYCEKYSMAMKPLAHTLAADPEVRHTAATLIQDSFGMDINLITNQMCPSTYLSVEASQRGKPGLSIDDINVFLETFINTLRIANRVSSSLYDLLNSCLGPIICAAKILTSEAHATSPGGDAWDSPIKDYNEELDAKLREFCHSLNVKVPKQKIKTLQCFCSTTFL